MKRDDYLDWDNAVKMYGVPLKPTKPKPFDGGFAKVFEDTKQFWISCDGMICADPEFIRGLGLWLLTASQWVENENQREKNNKENAKQKTNRQKGRKKVGKENNQTGGV